MMNSVVFREMLSLMRLPIFVRIPNEVNVKVGIGESQYWPGILKLGLAMKLVRLAQILKIQWPHQLDGNWPGLLDSTWILWILCGS